MCGIAGTVGAGRPDLNALERAARAMVRRGPDGQGVWRDEELGFAFRRLAIIDLDERSNQPLHFGRLHLVFNGEIYNYLELRTELVGLGHSFATEGDAEVLLHAWAEWEEGALDRVNGMFAFGIWDDERHRLTIAVDPFTEKPLLYCSTGERLLFASDVAALREFDPDVGVADERAIDDFVALNIMPELPRTFFRDVHRLPPAHLARWERGQLSVRCYWRPRTVPVPSDPAIAAEQLRELFSDSVKLRLRSDVPVGTSLSGGVDSSGVVGASTRLAGENLLHVFTAAFPGFERNEWGYAQEVARAANVAEHHAVHPTARELVGDLELLMRDQQEPFVSTSIYAQWRVMRAAREAGVIVLLDGQGGDELFGGYPGTAAWALRSTGPLAALKGLVEGQTNTRDLAIAYAVGHTPHALESYYRLRRASPYVSRAISRKVASLDPLPADWGEMGSPLRSQLYTQTFHATLPNLCRYGDRNSMAHSMELRMPYLDRRIADFAFSMPPDLVFHNGVTKRVLRAAHRGLVPDKVLDRRDKVCYETPEGSWLNDPACRSHIAQVVLDPSLRASERYDLAALERDYRAGSWSDVNALWRIFNVELWLQSFAPVASVAAAV